MKKRGYMVWLAVIVFITMLTTSIPGFTLTKASAATDSGPLLETQTLSSDPTVIATIPIPLENNMVLGDIAVNPSTNRIYVANRNINSTYSDSNISVIDGSNNNVIATIKLDLGPIVCVAVNPTSNRIYVSYSNINSVSVIDGVTNSIVATINLGSSLGDIAVNPNTNRIYVRGSNNVSVIDGATNNVLTTVNLGSNLGAIAVNPNTNRIYVGGSNNVSVIDGATNNLIATVNAGWGPLVVVINPDTNLFYTANFFENTISVIDGFTNSVVTKVDVAQKPWEVAVNPNTNRIFITNQSNYNNYVWVIDGTINSLITTPVTVGSSPTFMAVNPNTSRIYVVNFGNKSVSVIQDGLAQTITGTVAGVPVPTGGLNEYALSLKIVSSSDSRFSIGQQVWCAAKTTDFPELLTLGATLAGTLDNSLGWWVLKPGAVTPPPTIPTVTGTVASVPVPTGGLNEYALSLQIVSTSDSRFSIGQQVWCAASTADFPNLLTVGATLSGNLDNTLGWWVFKKI